MCNKNSLLCQAIRAKRLRLWPRWWHSAKWDLWKQVSFFVCVTVQSIFVQARICMYVCMYLVLLENQSKLFACCSLHAKRIDSYRSFLWTFKYRWIKFAADVNSEELHWFYLGCYAQRYGVRGYGHHGMSSLGLMSDIKDQEWQRFVKATV